MQRTSVSLAVVLALVSITAVGCRKEDDPPPASPSPYGQTYPPGYGPGPAPGYPNGGYPPPNGGYPQGPVGPGPGAPPQSPQAQPMARAAGFPCASDADFVCPLAHCVNGTCGGCSSDADCKPNGACGPTPFGAACLVRTAGAPHAGPTPPAPSPTSPPQVPSAPPVVPPPVPVPTGADRFANARQLCVDRTNMYRARVGARPVVRRTDREACVDDEAQKDSRAGSAHASFGTCKQGAQNECPDYPGQSPESTLSDCLAQMFAEGPGEPYADHGHYLNMVDPSFTGVACGFFTTASGKLWITQDFFR